MKIPDKNWLEWLVFSAGLLLLLGTCGYLISQSLHRGAEPASLSVELGESSAPGGADPAHYVVPLTVRNDGGRTATEVGVEVEMRYHGLVERRELTFDFVPRGSTRSGAVTFEHPPDPDTLAARVLGYLDP
jgi:uncharacterized protein (TIGR02588 family)